MSAKRRLADLPQTPRPSAPSDLDVVEVVQGTERYVILSFAAPSLERYRLTPAERDVLALMLEGRTNAEIGARRGTSARTVANQTASLFRKLGVASRLELARWSYHAAPGPDGTSNR